MSDFTSNRSAEAAQLLAECAAREIRVWLSRGVVSACVMDGSPLPESLRSRLIERRAEIAELIGYEGQRFVHAAELRGGSCRVYWLRQAVPVDATATDGNAA